MKFNFMTVAKHNELMAAKDKKIQELEAQIKNAGKSANSDETIAKLTAIFGDAAEEEGFDLEAAVSGLVEDLTTAQTNLENKEKDLTTAKADLKTANSRLTAAAKVLGHASAEGVDLAKEIGEIEPEGRTNPLDGKDKKVTSKEDEDITCEVDEELKSILKARGIN